MAGNCCKGNYRRNKAKSKINYRTIPKWQKSITIPEKRREPNGKWLKVIGARENNLKDIDVNFPLGVLTCVTGFQVREKVLL